MARTLTVEEESGTFTRRLVDNAHRGYYAGDFSRVPLHDPRRVVLRRGSRRAMPMERL
jgi:hypothetical protein